MKLDLEVYCRAFGATKRRYRSHRELAHGHSPGQGLHESKSQFDQPHVAGTASSPWLSLAKPFHAIVHFGASGLIMKVIRSSATCRIGFRHFPCRS
jgi:hypothetical protein